MVYPRSEKQPEPIITLTKLPKTVLEGLQVLGENETLNQVFLTGLKSLTLTN